jgi:cellulose synthase/poly-beta-1,6-N-acetylglucosamine synthase-like glycosyltransferase
MSTFLFIFYVFSGVFGIIYGFLIVYYTVGWYRLPTYHPTKVNAFHTHISVIVPARNEGRNIPELLSDLLDQTLSKAHYEVLIVDDHSTDDTATLVEKFIEDHPALSLKLIRLTSEKRTTAFKKRAIEEAIRMSSGDLIVTTDADCRLGKRWLETLVAFYEEHKPKMVVAPVSYHNETSMFEKMQTEEFLSLIAITGGAIRMGHPIMCNGANLAYEKAAFKAAGGFGSTRFSSGDDVFLMLRIRKLFGSNAIRFLKHREAIVHTEARKKLSDFLQQRTRWASKNKGYEFNILVVSFTVYMVNLLILTGMVRVFLYPSWWPVLLTILVIKVLIDLPILVGIGNFVKRPGIIGYSIPLVVLYPFYIVLVGALGILGNYQWKGRKVKN